LVELQGGEIGVESESGVGSSFNFYLMTRRSEQAIHNEKVLQEVNSDIQSKIQTVQQIDRIPQVMEKLSLQSFVESKPQVASPNARSWHVLIVEDNLVNQRILAHQLRKIGCTVHVANHGKEALSIIETCNVYRGQEHGRELSVVLMDLEMPVMNGLECVKRIRSLEADGAIVVHIPIIAVSANVRAEHISMAMESGMVSAFCSCLAL
jgi:CheY-like chemotaxis protein